MLPKTEPAIAPERSGPGRPRIELTDILFEQAVAMARIHCTAEEMCAVLGMCDSTLDLRLKERGYANFQDFYKKHSAEGKASLRRLQFKKAEAGDTGMLIWLGKQQLGQKDLSKAELTGANDAPLWSQGGPFAAAVLAHLRDKHQDVPGLDREGDREDEEPHGD